MGTGRWLLAGVLLVALLTSCLADRAKTGVVIHNASGRQICISVQYTSGEEQFVIPDRIEMLVLSDFADGGSRSPQLREDLLFIAVTVDRGGKITYNRAQLLKEAHWDRKSRQWLLTIR